jgi:hypothetical protein
VCSGAVKPNGTPCHDRNVCTLGETCQEGTCTGGQALVCAAPDACHVAWCARRAGCRVKRILPQWMCDGARRRGHDSRRK